jgi:hypothetical protein
MSPEATESFPPEWLPAPELVEQAVQFAIQLTTPSRIYLYPAWDGDDATCESDLNMAILMPSMLAARMAEMRRALKAQLEELPMQVEVLMATEEFAQQRFNHPGSVFYHLFREGRMVYQQ